MDKLTEALATLCSDEDNIKHFETIKQPHIHSKPMNNGKGTRENVQAQMANTKKYTKRKGHADMAGQKFEIKMLTLLYIRAIRQNLEFNMASNMEEAGVFDDIVFTNFTQPTSTTFMQLKHKQTQKLTCDNLFCPGNDFNILKYFKSYLNMKILYQSNNEDLKECSAINNWHLVMFTNAQIEPGIGTETQVPNFWYTKGSEFIFCEESDLELFKIFKDLPAFGQFLCDIDPIMKEACEHQMKIEKHIQKFSDTKTMKYLTDTSRNNVNLEPKKGSKIKILHCDKTHYADLLVIVKEAAKHKTLITEKIKQFTQSNMADEISKLRNPVKENLQTHNAFPNVDLEKLRRNETKDDMHLIEKLLSNIKHLEGKMSAQRATFLEHALSFNETLSNKVMKLLENPTEKKWVKLINEMSEFESFELPPELQGKLRGIVEQIYQYTKTKQLYIQQFIDSARRKCLATILNKVTKKWNMKEFNQLKDMMSGINISELKEFLQKLILCTGQANENELNSVIKQEIQSTCQTSQFGTEEIFNNFTSEIQCWWEKSNIYLTKAYKVKGLDVDYGLSVISQLNNPKLKTLDMLRIKFEDWDVGNLEESNFVNVVCESSTTILGMMKVWQALESKHHLHVIVDLQSALSSLPDLKKVWPSNTCHWLVIESQIGSWETTALQENLVEHVNSKQGRLIIVSAPNDPLVQGIQRNLNIKGTGICDAFQFSQLDAVSQRFVMRKDVIFQGKKVCLEGLLESGRGAQLRDSLTAKFVVKLLTSDDVHLGPQLVSLTGNYIPRTLDYGVRTAHYGNQLS